MMAPTSPRAALHLLTTVLLVSTIANAVALPHQVLDPRIPIVQGEQIPEDVSAALRASVGDDPNVFQDVEDAFRSRTGLEVIRDFFARIFGWNNKDDDDKPAETSTPSTSAAPSGSSTESSVSATATPSEAPAESNISSEPTSSETSLMSSSSPRSTGTDTLSEESPEATPTPSPSNDFSILPVGPVTTAINATLPEESPETTPTPSPSNDFSILPVGPVTTAINATLPDPVFSLPPFLNSTSGPLPTAVPITGEFSAIPYPGTGLPSNSTVPTGIQLTTIPLVTAPVSSLPLGTGTGSPISFTEIPFFPNTTVSIATGLPGTGTAVGTGAPISFTEVPFYPNTTSGLATALPGTGTAVGTGAPISFTEIPFYPNTTSGVATPIPGTGTAVGTGAPISFTEIPLYSNSTTIMTTVAPSGTGVIGTGIGTGSPAVITEIPAFPNVTTIFTTTTTTLVGTGVPSLLPTNNGTASNDTSSAFPGLSSLRRICQDPSIKVVTLPLISRFYGPSGYPTLQTFPGCTIPNNRQAIQAPGLLNCSALGAEVQRCQASGRKVLLSVKADGLEAVGGNEDFGDPSVQKKPYGPSYGDNDDEGATDDSGNSSEDVTFDNDKASGDDNDVEKRQFSLDINFHFPPFNFNPFRPHRPTPSKEPSGPKSTARPGPPPRPNQSEKPPRPQEPSSSPVSSPTTRSSSQASATVITESFVPVISVSFPPLSPTTVSVAKSTYSTSQLSASVSGEVTSSSATSASAAITAAPVTSLSRSATPSAVPTIPDPTPFPNLFNENHPPTAFALTLFSLFGEGHTERADLRPLGPEVGGPASPKIFNGTEWVNPPTSIVPMLERPLGEEVVVDGFDVQVPVQWKGKYQDTKFRNFVARLRELNRDAFKESGGIEGGSGDLGANGEPVVYFGWVGQLLRHREAAASKAGWIEWDGSS